MSFSDRSAPENGLHLAREVLKRLLKRKKNEHRIKVQTGQQYEIAAVPLLTKEIIIQFKKHTFHAILKWKEKSVLQQITNASFLKTCIAKI